MVDEMKSSVGSRQSAVVTWRSVVSGQRSMVRGQWSAVSGLRKNQSHRDDNMVEWWWEEQEFPPFDNDYQKDKDSQGGQGGFQITNSNYFSIAFNIRSSLINTSRINKL
jgi:hypothetical protein